LLLLVLLGCWFLSWWCRLASADVDGCVVVWDVLTAAPIARINDLPAAREVLRDYAARVSSGDMTGSSSSSSSSISGGITSLAWVMPGSDVLAMVVAPALLLLWEVTSKLMPQPRLIRADLISGGSNIGRSIAGRLTSPSSVVYVCIKLSRSP
jgi:hypothetical protein